jgi:hypothetical protein
MLCTRIMGVLYGPIGLPAPIDYDYSTFQSIDHKRICTIGACRDFHASVEKCTPSVSVAEAKYPFVRISLLPDIIRRFERELQNNIVLV